jgi:recombination protein RecA
MGVEAGIVDKSGAWFAFGTERLGQGRENVRAFLQENAGIREAIEKRLMEHLGLAEAADAPGIQGEADDGM